MHRVRRIPITGWERNFYFEAFRRLYLSRLHPASGFLWERELVEIAGARARTTAAVMIKRIQSRLRKCRETRRQSDGEGTVSFYGALNSDEVARPVYRREGEDDPNYLRTDKQTAAEMGRGRGG